MQIYGLSQESFLQATNTVMLKVACSAWGPDLVFGALPHSGGVLLPQRML